MGKTVKFYKGLPPREMAPAVAATVGSWVIVHSHLYCKLEQELLLHFDIVWC